MKIFRYIGIAIAAAFALAFASPSIIANVVVSTYRRAKTLVLDGIRFVLKAFTTEQSFHRLSKVMLIQSCAYATRIAKRERPRVEGMWRMCPSA